jgi:hypothetical protein
MKSNFVSTSPNPASQALERIPRGLWLRLAMSYGILGTVAIYWAPEARPDEWYAHGIWCLVGLGVALATLTRAFRQGFGVILSDHRLMFLAAFSLYFLFGASLLAVGPAVQAEVSLRYYPIVAGDALLVDGLNGLGFGIALLVSALTPARWFATQARTAAAKAARIPAHVVISVFLFAGIAVSLYVIPFELQEQGILPGLLYNAKQLSLVAVFLAVAYRGKSETAMRALGLGLAGLSSFAGILGFSKTAALVPLAVAVGAMAMRFSSRKVLPFGLAVLVAGYLTLGNLVNYGRNAIRHYGGGVSLEQRWVYLRDGWRESLELSDDDAEYSPWARLCYVPAQAAAINFQNAGHGGDGLSLMFWVLVPRVLFPDKPEITKTSTEFHSKITGQEGSAMGSGIFCSGYYHGGWWGFLLASVLCGWILAQTSAIARSVLENGALIMLPFALMGVLIAFRIDGDFVSDYFGVFVFIAYPLLATSLFLDGRALAGRPAPSES